MATARSRNWSESPCMVEVKNVLRCFGRRVVCRAACRGNCGARLSPGDNMLSDHTQSLAGTKRNDPRSLKCSISYRKTRYYNNIHS